MQAGQDREARLGLRVGQSGLGMSDVCSPCIRHWMDVLAINDVVIGLTLTGASIA